jgi:hypothetical protein
VSEEKLIETPSTFVPAAPELTDRVTRSLMEPEPPSLSPGGSSNAASAPMEVTPPGNVNNPLGTRRTTFALSELAVFEIRVTPPVRDVFTTTVPSVRSMKSIVVALACVTHTAARQQEHANKVVIFTVVLRILCGSRAGVHVMGVIFPPANLWQTRTGILVPAILNGQPKEEAGKTLEEWAPRSESHPGSLPL